MDAGRPTREAHRARVAARLALCAACPERQPGTRPMFDRCKACGCLIRGKAQIPGWSCPRGKW